MTIRTLRTLIPTSNFHAAVFCKRGILSLFCLFVFMLPVPVEGYEWNSTEYLRGWNISSAWPVQRTDEGVLISAQPSDLKVVMSSFRDITHDASSVRMLYRTMTVGASATCMLLSRGAVAVVQECFLVTGKSWKECHFKMNRKDEHAAPIDTVVIEFRQAESVEIKDIAVKGPSFSELFITQGLNAYSVNLLLPFTVYGYSLNLLLSALAAAFGLGIAGYYAIKKKSGALALMGIIFLSFYIGLDVREDYEEMSIMKAHTEDYISAAPSDRMFYSWDNLVEFSEFIRKNVSADTKSVVFVGSNLRYAYLRYLLYPIKLEQRENEAGDVNVFSAINNLRLEGNTLYLNDKMLLHGRKGLAFGWRSFLLLDPAR